MTIKNRVVGVDISLEQTTYAIVDIRGNIIARASFATTDIPNPTSYAAHLCDCIANMAEANGGYDTIRSIGISAPNGNYLTGCIENAHNLHWSGSIPLAAMMRDRLGLAVALGNDAHVTALGEHVFGSAHGMENFVCICLGTGIGSCIFSHNRAHLGADGFAGEFGHSCVINGGRLCGCGQRGCLEAYCAHKGIVQTATELMEESTGESLMRHLDKLSPHTIADCCNQGDEMAIEVYRRTGMYLGIALANLASVVDPEAIIFTGGISKAGHWLIDPAYESFEEHVFHNIKGRIKLLCSTLEGSERDVLGASALAWGFKEYSLFK